MDGYPRYTKDIDIWVKPESDNAQRVLKTLEDFGFGSLDLKTSDFLESNQIIQLGFPPNRIALLSTLAGVTFDKCFSAKTVVELEGFEMFFLDLASLIKNKQATGRPQDIADVANLQNETGQ